MAHPTGADDGRLSPPEPEPEPECRICYERFDGRARRPELLPCGHRVCARCLRRMAGPGGVEPPGGAALRCPFCRREATLLPSEAAAGRPPPPPLPELLLCPGAVAEAFPEASPSDCLAVTLLEVPGGGEGAAAPGGLREVLRLYGPAGLASGRRRSSPPGKPSPAARPAGRLLPRCLLALLALLYVASLPLGLYLLQAGRLGPGLVLAGLVPSSLLLGLLGSGCPSLGRWTWRNWGGSPGPAREREPRRRPT